MSVILLGSILLIAFAVAVAILLLAIRKGATKKLPLIGFCCVFVLASLALYWHLGSFTGVVAKLDIQDTIAQKGAEQAISDAIANLEEKVKANPSNFKLKLALAQSYELTQQYDKALTAYKGLLAYDPEEPRLLAKFVQYDYLVNANLSEDGQKSLDKLLALDPNDYTGLSVKASILHQAKQYLAAAKLWHQMLLFAPQTSPISAQAKSALEDEIALFSAADGQKWQEWLSERKIIRVIVNLAEEVKTLVRKTDTLFVAVKVANQARPLAAKRLTEVVFPVQLVITEADLLIPGSKFPDSVLLKARISQSGDVQTTGLVSEEVSVSIAENNQSVSLIIAAP